MAGMGLPDLGWMARLRVLLCQIRNSPIATAVLLHDWRGLFLSSGIAAPCDVVWAVRRDWPAGDHEFLAPRRRRASATRALTADANYWRRGPLRPRHCLVQLTLAEFRSHTVRCQRATCPTGAATVPAVKGR